MGGAGDDIVEVAVADDRQGLLGERSKHQFALAAIRQDLACQRIDDFGQEMILPDG